MRTRRARITPHGLPARTKASSTCRADARFRPTSSAHDRDFYNPTLRERLRTSIVSSASLTIAGVRIRFRLRQPGRHAIPPVERLGVFGRATFQLNADHQLFAEVGYAANRNDDQRGADAGFSTSRPLRGIRCSIPTGGPYYPTAFAAANGISGDLNLFYRTVPLGPRVNEVDDLGVARRRRRRGDRGRLDLWRGADLQPQSTERKLRQRLCLASQRLHRRLGDGPHQSVRRRPGPKATRCWRALR